jgi:hypothetical protein
MTIQASGGAHDVREVLVGGDVVIVGEGRLDVLP